MKILIVTQIYPGYKQETRQTSPFAIHYFASEWIKQGHDVEVVRMWPYRPFPLSLVMDKKMGKYAYRESFDKDNVRVHRLPVKKIPAINFLQRHIKHSKDRIQEEVKVFNPDLILCHAISPDFFLGCQLADQLHIPIFLTIHKTDINYLSKKSGLKKFNKYKSKLNGLFFRSNVLKEKYSNICELEQEGRIIPSGIDEREILKIEEFYNKSKIVSLKIVVACNLIKSKRVGTIIHAVHRLGLKYQVTLKVIGDGPERSNLENYVKENRLEKTVEFLGSLSRKEVLTFMYNSDIFVMVSAPETFGLVYIEAMSKGCIVIGSKGEGIDGFIRHGKNGFLCEVDNVEELYGIMECCLNQTHEEKKSILLESYKTVKELTTEKCAEKYMGALKKYMSKL
ncbi:glycosyltransferase [Alkalihalophilus sp. As8PL]|uniref:Glycosyltransferase n=1 Tax=Alkalihalophilus sp. As8PL TaxID=3237103 RepID=A0AB39BPF0_9BACI